MSEPFGQEEVSWTDVARLSISMGLTASEIADALDMFAGEYEDYRLTNTFRSKEGKLVLTFQGD